MELFSNDSFKKNKISDQMEIRWLSIKKAGEFLFKVRGELTDFQDINSL